jgi:hypothetical protein
MLTEHAARNAAPKKKPYKLSDFAGLYLLVQPHNSKWGRLKYRLKFAELRRRWRPEISFSLSEAGELMIATRTLRMRLSVPHTNALRGYLLSQPERQNLDTPQPDTVRLDHAAQ